MIEVVQLLQRAPVAGRDFLDELRLTRGGGATSIRRLRRGPGFAVLAVSQTEILFPVSVIRDPAGSSESGQNRQLKVAATRSFDVE